MSTLNRREAIKTTMIGLTALSGAFPDKLWSQNVSMEKKSKMIHPFTANVPQAILEDLKERLKSTRWPDRIAGSAWSYGADLDYMQELTTYWHDRFDWRKVEKQINGYPNFIAKIDNINIHFIHVKGKGKKSVPLIITHGWPGSFLEMMKMIPLLTEDPDFSFDLVIPSVIGFGFSDKVTHQGCNSSFVASLWHKLMLLLGYGKYGAQGGDIGSGISSWLAMNFPENLIGLHLNYISGSYKPYIKDGEKVSEEMLEFQRAGEEWSSREGAYASIHSTKPLTVAYSLNDSPVGLCAWIVEKFNGWSDNRGYIENAFTKDELLANVTLYWVTKSIHSSMRIYNENSKKPLVFDQGDFIKSPVAFAKFPKELPTPPRSYIEKGYNIIRWTEFPAGGHFAAVEQPEMLAADIRDFFLKL